MHPKNRGSLRFVNATIYSLKGLKAAYQSESAIRQELAAICVLIPLALWLDVSIVEKLLMISSLFLVIIVELLNTAVEAVVDRVGYDTHELSGKAKDVGSAAVFVSLLLVGLIWLVVIINRYA